MLMLDTETIGLTGPIVLIQYGNEKATLHYVWDEPVQKTLYLIEWLMQQELCLYNSSYDSFHINKLYNLFILVKDKSKLPDPQEIFNIEQSFDYQNALCCKPKNIIDPFVIFRKKNFQHLVNKKPVNINRVPIVAANLLKEELERFVKQELPPILFQGYKDKTEYWEVIATKDPQFVNFKLSFRPNLKLKNVIKYLTNREVYYMNIPQRYQPIEEDYCPYNYDWPKLLDYHQKYWKTADGIQYATQDIIELDNLVKQVDLPNFDMDSVLAWSVGACRFKGYAIDNDKLKKLIETHKRNSKEIDTAPRAALKYIHEALEPLERMVITSTSEKSLRSIIDSKPDSEAAKRCLTILEQRKLDKQMDILNKLSTVGRFHPDFHVIGTATCRMSGSGKINPQGINRHKSVRELFILKDPGYCLSGGDFSQQEAAILAAIINNEQLTNTLKSGIKIHKILASYIYDTPIDDVKQEQYDKAKNCFYGYIYGAQEEKLSQTAQVSIEQIRRAFAKFADDYPGILKEKNMVYDMFCSMRQPNGIGSNVVWAEPADRINTLFEYTRTFIIENIICEYLYNLATHLLPEIKDIKGFVRRRDREQRISGAVQSALFAAAFQIQAQNLRQAGNARIQGTGAYITKYCQLKVWNLQSVGIDKFSVQPYNVHDELQVPTTIPNLVKEVIDDTINELRSTVPLLKIEWKEDKDSWAEK